MADGGFNFRSVERREVKRFEPPPWEQDQFEELTRQRTEQEALEREAEQARLAAVTTVVAAAEKDTTEEAPAETEGVVVVEAVPPIVAGVAPDEARVAAMLAELAAEEPKAPQTFWKTNVIVGGALFVCGVVFLIWGMAALVAARRSGAAGMLGGFVILLFGAGFVFGGLYVVVRSLRQRGVL